MAHFLPRLLAAFGTLAVLGLCPGLALASTLHVSPDGTFDGSSAVEPTSMEDALDSAEAGDEIVLHEGYYGDLTLFAQFEEETFVVAADGENVRLRTLTIEGSEHLTVSGMSISLSHADTYQSDTMVSVVGGSSFVTVRDCDIFSVPDSQIGDWSASDWADLPGTAVNVRSPDIVISGNRIRNVAHGIAINYDAPRCTVSHNHIQNFSRDGLRGVADDGLFEYNTVLDAYDVDDHHDDFFQSWSYEDGVVGTTVVRGIVLRGNLFVNFTDPERPFAGSAQGIGCFDGFFEDWVVENNVVIVNHWHGITFLGARNMRIVNNTVLDNLLDDGPGPPWIDVSAHKDGSASSDIVISNNLTQDITLEADNSTEERNIFFDDPSAFFVDHLNFDLHLIAGADAIDAGTADGAPALDFDRIARPVGAGIDVGAFEWHDGSVGPVDPSSPVTGMGGAGNLGSGGSGKNDDPGDEAETDSGGGSVTDPEGSTDAGADAAEAGGCSCHQGAAQNAPRGSWMRLILLGGFITLISRRRRLGAH